jgi:hypothetical protein
LVLGVALGVTWSTAASAQQAPVAAFPIESPAAAEKPTPEPLPKPERREQPAVRTAIVGLQALNHDAQLQSNWQPSGTASDWYVVCMAPCTRRVPVDATFRVAGSGFTPSEPFHLPPGRDPVLLTSKLKHRSLALPITLTVVGFTSLGAIGPTLIVLGALANTSAVQSYATNSSYATAGAAFMIGGAVLATVGLVMLITTARNKHSSVTVARQATPRLKLLGSFALEPRGLTF